MTRNACEMCALRENSRTLDACILLSLLPPKLYLRSQFLSMKRTSVRKVGKLTFLAFALCWSQFALSLSKPAEAIGYFIVSTRNEAGGIKKDYWKFWKDKLYKKRRLKSMKGVPNFKREITVFFCPFFPLKLSKRVFRVSQRLFINLNC